MKYGFMERLHSNKEIVEKTGVEYWTIAELGEIIPTTDEEKEALPAFVWKTAKYDRIVA